MIRNEQLSTNLTNLLDIEHMQHVPKLKIRLVFKHLTYSSEVFPAIFIVQLVQHYSVCSALKINKSLWYDFLIYYSDKLNMAEFLGAQWRQNSSSKTRWWHSWVKIWIAIFTNLFDLIGWTGSWWIIVVARWICSVCNAGRSTNRHLKQNMVIKAKRLNHVKQQPTKLKSFKINRKGYF